MPDGERFLRGARVPVLKIPGNFSRLRAKPAHLVGHLPANWPTSTGANSIEVSKMCVNVLHCLQNPCRLSRSGL